MKTRRSIYIAFLFLTSAANAAGKPDFYACPVLDGKQAVGISLYSGHPSELAELKPENADTDDRNPAFWSTETSEYDYWGVCIYGNAKPTYEFKLTKKVYSRCTNIGSGKTLDKLKCK